MFTQGNPNIESELRGSKAKMCEHSNGWRPEDGVPDLAMMTDITDLGINLNLKTRYLRDQIYTFSGSILLAVNPYKQLNIYSNEWITRYRGQKLDQTDPHVFALTEAMYMNLVMQEVNSAPSKLNDKDLSSNNITKKLETGEMSSCHNTLHSSVKSIPSSNNSSFSMPSSASCSLTSMVQRNRNQACVISGESGAGKTETTKFILSYLCSITPNKSTWMEHQILEANTILEAFGNAKTVRNDNSSRFGKFIQICFDSRYQINGCVIQDYLLEQSRITYQSIGERNYHVFYQLLSAGQANSELREKFHLMPANYYSYLNKTQCFKIGEVDDCAMFDSLRTALSVLNMDQDFCDGLFSILSGILWLGNIQFYSDESGQSDQCSLTESDSRIVEIVSKLLGLEINQLEHVLLRRQINVRGSITEIPYKLFEAKDNRNAMAKALYSKLFSWVVNFINSSTNPGLENTSFLGVLDIFGFENFEINSFEQLCINYANEKLHKFFNHHMFAMEQELYQREGIQFYDINYTDNTLCLELLEKPPNCILRLLSEECRIPKGSDSSFNEKIHQEFASTNPHPFYVMGNDKRNWSIEFSVKHFAGLVTYKTCGFLKKNKDTQQNQLLDVIESATNPLLRELVKGHALRKDSVQTSESSAPENLSQNGVEYIFPVTSKPSNRINEFKLKLSSQQSFCFPASASQNSKPKTSLRRESSFNFDCIQTNSNGPQHAKSRPTVADSFRHQLCSLVELLNSVKPWYVRCIKPNIQKTATDYDDQQVLQQLRYLGMTDLIKIRREGYPIHLTKHQFVCRYRCLMLKFSRSDPQGSPIKLDPERLDCSCMKILRHFKMDENDWKIGKSMVLLRVNIYQPLEDKRNSLFTDMATLIQSCWKGFIKHREFTKKKQAAIRIQETFRAYRGRLLFLRKKRAALTIQAYIRGMFAREIANALREIKRVEMEKAKRLSQLENVPQDSELRHEIMRSCDSSDHINEGLEIVITGSEPTLDTRHPHSEEAENLQVHILNTNGGCSPMSQSNISPNISSSSSWQDNDLNSEDAKAKLMNMRDKKEMENLVKVLERHGISFNPDEQSTDADFEKLYDVLGNQLQINCDAQSISPSINEDDRCSFATVETGCDGDSVSCSGQSQVSSTMTDEHTFNDEKKASELSNERDLTSDSNVEETVNQIQNSTESVIEDNRYHSNSIESIASIVSSSSVQSNLQLSQTNKQGTHHSEQIQAESIMKQVSEGQVKISTFTGNPLLVTGSKLVTNGRPLTRIEEEPNSTASSPSKTPCKKTSDASSRPQSLFPPADQEMQDQSRLNAISENKRRRLERKIIQVQQERQFQQPINPTTAGTLTSNDSINQTTIGRDSAATNNENDNAIYSKQKSNIIEYAQQSFNNHLRDPNGGGGVIRTLTRRRRSVDTSASELLSKGEMLSYNSSFVIPTSHIKMHDPHNAQISCSMFKNLCKYMTGESVKLETEVRIIQSIIRHGIEKIELRDEIYVQIIRQLTNNPNQDYCRRLWIILGLVSAAFSPSKSFSKHLIAYLQSKPKKDPSITCHAQFCLDNLQAPRLHQRKYPPSPLEIQACKSLTNLTCKVYLLDGRIETLSVHPCDTALDALTKLAHKISLQSTEGWSLYESYTPGYSKYPHPAYEHKGDFERSIRSHMYMADLMASWQEGLPKNISLKLSQRRLDGGNFRLTLKKRIFRGPRIRNDPVEINLLYAQAVYNVVKKDCFLVDDNLATSLAGLQAQVILGNVSDIGRQEQKKGKQVKLGMVTNKHTSQMYDIENYICQRLRHQASRSKKDWSILIAQSHKQLHGVNEVLCKMRYLSMVIYHCPLYGTATFYVTYRGYQNLDQNLILGVNAEGLVLIRSSDRALLNAYRFNSIAANNGITVYSDENIIQFSVKDPGCEELKCLSFEAAENEEIAMLMVSYCPQLSVSMRGTSSSFNFTLDPNFDLNASKKKPKLKMTLEDRMRTHQEVQNARKAVVKSGKLRKPCNEENSAGLLKHTLKRFSSTRLKNEKSRFENIYGTNTKTGCRPLADVPQTSSDYNLNGSFNNQTIVESELNESNEIAGATATTVSDDITKVFPHRYWAYTKSPLRSSLLIIHDPELEEAALTNFNAILTYSGLLNFQSNGDSSSCTSTIDCSSIDSGIASQQSLINFNGKTSNGGQVSMTQGDIYDVCPKKIDDRELLRLAQEILDRCLKKDADILKNEFFLQLIKQTTDHPEPNSEINQRHWQLLALACSITHPSDCKILAYLYAHLRRCSLDQVTDEGQYAQFTLRSLQGTLDTKGRRFAPSETEILSTINCRRIYARVYFLDGQFQAVEFDPCATIAEVVEQIKQKIGLRPDCTGYALFQPLDDDCEQVLHPEEKVGDAIAAWEAWHKAKRSKSEQASSSQQQDQPNNGSKFSNKASLASLGSNSKNRTHRFIFKKYLFLDSMIDLENPVEAELLYYQTVACIKEDKFPVLEQEATILCALKAQIEIGNYTKLCNLPREHVRMVYKQVVMSLMPPHAFNNLPIPAIAQQHQSLRELSCTDTKKYFFNLVQSIGRANYPNNPGYILLHRSHVYDATQTFATAWPSDIWVVINQSGLHMLITKSRRVLASCEYRNIVEYNSNNNYLMVIISNNQNKIKYTFYTKQAQQIAQQMRDYIVINSSGGSKRRKSVEFNLNPQNSKQATTRAFSNNNEVQY